MRVLLAIDGSEASEAALENVMSGFPADGTDVKVLHAVEWLKEMPLCFQFAQGGNVAHDIVACRNQSFARARQLVEGAATRLALKGFRTSTSTPDADPRHAIVDAARQWPADLIVLGSHGRRGVDRWLLGSVAEAVARHATCSVEIVRAPVAA